MKTFGRLVILALCIILSLELPKVLSARVVTPQKEKPKDLIEQTRVSSNGDKRLDFFVIQPHTNDPVAPHFPVRPK